MRISSSPQMVPIYLALLCYGIAFTALLLNSILSGLSSLLKIARSAAAQPAAQRLASLLYLMGFICAAAAFAGRWKQLGHIPLQSMFDVFLAMGMAIYPLTRFCRRLGARFEPFDMFLGFVLIFPAAFIFPSEPQKLPPALQSFLFGPHVAAYLLGYIVMAKAAAHALCHLVRGDKCYHRVRVIAPDGKVSATFETPDSKFFAQLGASHRDSPAAAPSRPAADTSQPSETDLVIFRLVCLGFPFLTLGLVLGSWWGQIAWGDYWGWDPKEMWSLATWLIFVLYFHVRYAWPAQQRLRSLVVVLGFVAIIITILWVNLSRLFPGLHNYAS